MRGRKNGAEEIGDEIVDEKKRVRLRYVKIETQVVRKED